MTDVVVAVENHPAKYSEPIARAIRREIAALAIQPLTGALLVDPFAGTGQALDDIQSVATTLWGDALVHGIELEPEWAACSPLVRQGDARALPFEPGTVSAIFTSPSYGNRLADPYRTDATAHTVLTYAQKLGRNLSDGSGAAMQWGPKYRELHEECIAEWWRVLVPGGAVILNISDHERGGKPQHVTSWWVTRLLARGFLLRRCETIHTRRFRRGTNGQRRVPGEQLITFAKPHPDYEEL